jgi:cytoskeletal protein RodZ
VSSVGETLRAAREVRQLSLAQVQAELAIPLHYLEAMEGGGSKLIADEFYLVPFLRRYGDFLDIDGASLIARFLAESAGNEAAASRLPEGATRRTRPWMWVAGAALCAALAGWFLWRPALDDRAGAAPTGAAESARAPVQP